MDAEWMVCGGVIIHKYNVNNNTPDFQQKNGVMETSAELSLFNQTWQILASTSEPIRCQLEL